MLQTLLAKCGLQDHKYKPSSVIIFVLAALCAVLPLTIDQLTCAIAAAVVYALYQEYNPSQSRKPESELKRPISSSASVWHSGGSTSRSPTRTSLKLPPGSAAAGPQLSSQQACPLTPPGRSTKRDLIDREVDALLVAISPSSASDKLVRELARTVKQTIGTTFPEAEVVGFATGDLTTKTSLGMCVPEVDIVVRINPDSLPQQLSGRLSRTGGASTAQLDARKVQKSAIRACTDRLVSDGGFKFRRSAFKGQEPKITLLTPASFSDPLASIAAKRGIATETPSTSSTDEAAAIPVDLSVNTVTPHCTDAVLRACRRFDPRAQGLIILVRRWARDRGICHSAKGYLSPYAWSLLAAFFLQVAPADDVPYLPALQGIRAGDTGFTLQQTSASPKAAAVEWAPEGVEYANGGARGKKSVSSLFKDFVLFYSKDFNWRSEAVSLRMGKRAAPDLSLPLHIVVSSTGIPTQVGPHIQDPFDSTSNLGTSVTDEGFARMREELARASTILLRSSPRPSLAELLEPWVPPTADAEPPMN